MMNQPKIRSHEQLIVFITLAVMTTVGLGFIVIESKVIDMDKLNLLLPFFGIIVAKFGDACGFFNNSSAGSTRKTELSENNQGTKP